jgi:hypothetical protein
MTKDNDNRVPSPEELGIPSGSLDPAGSLKEESGFYDKIGRTHSSIIRAISVLFITSTFIIPPLLIINYMLFTDPPVNIDIIYISAIIFVSLYFLAGIMTLHKILKYNK